MKLQNQQRSTLQQISEFQAMKLRRPNPPTEAAIKRAQWDRAFNYLAELKRPNPPTPEAIKRAQFVDKTYKWTGR